MSHSCQAGIHSEGGRGACVPLVRGVYHVLSTRLQKKIPGKYSALGHTSTTFVCHVMILLLLSLQPHRGMLMLMFPSPLREFDSTQQTDK